MPKKCVVCKKSMPSSQERFAQSFNGSNNWVCRQCLPNRRDGKDDKCSNCKNTPTWPTTPNEEGGFYKLCANCWTNLTKNYNHEDGSGIHHTGLTMYHSGGGH